jgi:DNA-binding GntR family transcriptional regulator
VSRNTVSAAYDPLTAEGFLIGQVGAGTFVRAGSVFFFEVNAVNGISATSAREIHLLVVSS